MKYLFWIFTCLSIFLNFNSFSQLKNKKKQLPNIQNSKTNDSTSKVLSNDINLTKYPVFKSGISKFSNNLIPLLNSNGSYSLVKFNTLTPINELQYKEVQYYDESNLLKVKPFKTGDDWQIVKNEKIIFDNGFDFELNKGQFFIHNLDIYDDNFKFKKSIKNLIKSKLGDYKYINTITKNGDWEFFRGDSTFLKGSTISKILEFSENEYLIFIDGNEYILEYDEIKNDFYIKLYDLEITDVWKNVLFTKPNDKKIKYYVKYDWNYNEELYRPFELGFTNHQPPIYKIEFKDTKTGELVNYFIVHDNRKEKIGVVNSKGELILNTIYSSISNFYSGYSIVGLENSKYIIDTNGSISFKNLYNSNIFPVMFLNEFIILLSNGNFLNLKTKNIVLTDKSVIIEQQHYEGFIHKFNSGLIKVKSKSNGLFGFMGIDGKLKIPTIYNEVTSFDNGFAIIHLFNKKLNTWDGFSIIDINGIRINDKRYSSIFSINNNLTYPDEFQENYNYWRDYEDFLTLKTSYINNDTGFEKNILNPRNYANYEDIFKLFHGFFKVKRDGRIFYVDINGKEYIN